MDYDFLRQHIGHEIVIVCYGGENEDPENIAIECETCSTVIADVHKDEHYEKHGLECPSCLNESEYMIEKDDDGKKVYHCLECDYECSMFN